MKTSKLSLFSLVAATALVGCALTQAQDDTRVAQLVHAGEAANVCTPDRKAHVNIPASALAQDTTITIDPAAPPPQAAGYTLVGRGYEYGPSGTKFGKKATIELHYDASMLPAGTSPNAIGILAVSDGGAKVEILPDAVVDAGQHAVWASTTHFTWFAPILAPNVQIGGPGGTPTFGMATTSLPLWSNVWLGPDGWVRGDNAPYASTAPTALSIRIDTAGALPNQVLRVEETLEDPAGSGTPWDRMPALFQGLGTMQTDSKGVLALTLDGHMLQYTVTQWVNGAPGYPSGRVHLRIYTPAPIDVYVSLALHPSVPR